MTIETIDGAQNSEAFMNSICARALQMHFEYSDEKAKKRVFPVELPKPDFPAIIYYAIGDKDDTVALSAVQSAQRLFRVDCRARKYSDVVALDKLIAQLIQKSARFGGHFGVFDESYREQGLDGDKAEAPVYQRIRTIAVFQ